MNNETNEMTMNVGQCALPLPRIPPSGRDAKSVVVYSPDIDFCVSFQMALEDHHQIVTTTDAQMLIVLVKTFKPNLVIIRAVPSRKVRQLLMLMKGTLPQLRIMFFVSARGLDHASFNGFLSLVDEVFYEPVGITKVIESIKSLLHE